MKLAVLGGSFNPVHVGHLYLADLVLSAFGYDRVVLVPAFESPFKLGAAAPSPQDRLAMLAASIPGDPRLVIDDCEIRREGVSYTVDTLKDIIRRYRPEGRPGLILGDDLARDFPKWRKSEEIAGLADIIVARRILSGEGIYPYPNRQLKNEVMEVSSAMVRERIREGGNWRYLVPGGARFIIEDKGLYRPGLYRPDLYEPELCGADSQEPDAAGTISRELIVLMEDTVRRRLNPARFLHSRNVAVMTSDLCRIFGLDGKAGYLAGIGHDIAKPLTGEELTDLAEKDGMEISRLERKKPSLLHGRAGAVMLRDCYGIQNREILDAVMYHTVCGAGMGPLAKALYIADKIEVSREGVDPALRDFSSYGEDGSPAALDRLFGKILNETVAWLRLKEVDLSEGTLRLLEVMEKRNTR
ncbi:MAG: nicotinate (nicotinamide) nucleotide adenylyltransferase [Treponema sp.]|nr:nicotinate (nicotinamide) nucleotide adenylyltransferase [Treponema sp.]